MNSSFSNSNMHKLSYDFTEFTGNIPCGPPVTPEHELQSGRVARVARVADVSEKSHIK